MSNASTPGTERIASLVFAITGERYEVVTTKTRGWWRAQCGPFESDKGWQGSGGETVAARDLLALVTRRAERMTSALRFATEDAEREAQWADRCAASVVEARKKLAEAEIAEAVARERAEAEATRLNAVLAASDDNIRAVWAALNTPQTVTTTEEK